MTTPTYGQAALYRTDIILAAGATNVYAFRYGTKANSAAPTVYVDLTGWTGQMQVRAKPDGDVWATATVVVDSIGHVTATIAAVDTNTRDWDTRTRGMYNLYLTSPSGVVIRFIEGFAICSPDVTHV